jgi:hypothetical protein
LRGCHIAIAIVAAVMLTAAGELAEPASDGLPQSAGEVIEQYIEAIGGRSAVEKLSTRTLTGYLVDNLSWHEPQVDTQRFTCQAGSDDRYVVRLAGRLGIEREGYDGKAAWRVDHDGVLHPNPDAAHSKLAWLVNPRHALRISTYFPSPRLGSIRVVEGRVCFAVESELPVEYFALYIDTETHLLRGIGWHWRLEDYRPVDGVMLPHRVVCNRKGGSSTYLFASIEHNRPLDGYIFRPPRR